MQSKSLGLDIDENLSWKEHIDHTVNIKKLLPALACLKELGHLSPCTLQLKFTLYQGFIKPDFDYCSAAWDGLLLQLTKSENLQETANCRYDTF